MFFVAIIASKGSVAAVLKVFYLVILLKLSCTTIKNFMCAMLPDCAVLVNTIPSQTKQVPRNIPLYKKADWDQFKQTMRDFLSELHTDIATTDVQGLWDKFASRLEQGIDKFIPTRKAGTCDGFPWINQEIRRLMRKRDKLYKRMKRSGRPNDTKKFQEYKHLVRRVIDRAYERYLGDILGINTTTEQEENSPLMVKVVSMISMIHVACYAPVDVFPKRGGGGGITPGNWTSLKNWGLVLYPWPCDTVLCLKSPGRAFGFRHDFF